MCKTWKQPKCPLTDKWIKKDIYNEMPCSHKKNKIMPFAAIWMKLEILILTEVSQKEKDKYYMISLICGTYNGTSLSTKQEQMHRHREQICGCQRGGSGMDWEFGASKLLHLEWIAMRSYLQQGTISSLQGETMMENNINRNIYLCTYIDWVNIYTIYDWVTLLYSRKWHNIVTQLYFSIINCKFFKNLKNKIKHFSKNTYWYVIICIYSK